MAVGVLFAGRGYPRLRYFVLLRATRARTRATGPGHRRQADSLAVLSHRLNVQRFVPPHTARRYDGRTMYFEKNRSEFPS